jgi:cell cycle checkpoint protein
MDKFETFLARAGNYRSVFSSGAVKGSLGSNPTPRNTMVLLEDLPNILHPGIRDRFHSAVQRHVQTSSVPVVIVVSDTGVRGEGDDIGAGHSRWSKADEVINRRTIVPPELGAAHITEIVSVNLMLPRFSKHCSPLSRFNAIAPTFLTSALKRVRTQAGVTAVSDAVLSGIVDGVSGDIRAAIMALEFACVRVGVGRGKKRGRNGLVFQHLVLR